MATNKTMFTASNDSSNASSPTNMVAPLMSHQTFLLVVDIFFSSIIATGVLGNALVIATVLRWKEMRSPCNLFLLNISVADLCLTGFGGALRIVEVHLGWVFGDFLCRFLAPLQDVFVSVSGITHSMIAWERYRATVTPFKPRISKGKTKRLLPLIWIASYVACGLPLAITTKQSTRGSVTICSPHWSVLYRRVYEVYLVAVFIVFQLVLQTFAYSNIIRTLRSSDGMFRAGTGNTSSESRSISRCVEATSGESRLSFSARTARHKQKGKTIRTLIVLVVVFQVCYIPRGTVMLISEFSKGLSPHYRYVELISLILYYLKHVINPAILFMMSTEFRHGLQNMFTCSKNHANHLNQISKGLGKIPLQIPLQVSSGGKSSSSGKSSSGGKSGKSEVEDILDVDESKVML